ncbi:MAG: sulfotransferase family protein [Methylococcales bacterium]
MKLVFIVGTGRCGSTFVHETLAKHKGFGFVSNIEDNLLILNRLGGFNSRLYRSIPGDFREKGALRFAPSEAYRIISREVSPIYSNSCRDLRSDDVTPWIDSRFRTFFESRNSAQGCHGFLHKYTGWSRLGFFQRIFPDAKFIHVIRDGRAVANSWLQMPWWGGYRGPENWLWGTLPKEISDRWRADGGSFAALSAIGWKILMEGYDGRAGIVPEANFLETRYEDVIENPFESFARMLEFAGLSMTSQFEIALSRIRMKRDRSRAFETDLTNPQIREMESWIGDLLQHHGYR